MKSLITAGVMAALLALPQIAPAQVFAPAEGQPRPSQLLPGDGAELPAADDEARANILVLRGTNDGTGIDKRLGEEERRKLAGPPFSSFNSYTLVSTSAPVINRTSWVSQALPNSDTLKLKLNDVKGGRYHVQINVTRSRTTELMNAELKAKQNAIVFVALPQGNASEILVLGIRVQPK